jgi:hypothetical protein
LKESPADRRKVADETTIQSPTPSAAYVTVYTFVVWDHDLRTTVIYPRMATPQTIAKMRGKMNEETAWIVDASQLDVEGFYLENK